MSKAGIQSNRGDGYQTLVAFDWALTVLSNPDYQWLEVDSVAWSVDDVVIGKVDGTKICCQCKKNQPEFRAWSITDLADELSKAIDLLSKDSTAEVHFYSRSAFGGLAALRELSRNYAEEAGFQAGLGTAHRETDRALTDLITKQGLKFSTYELLSRTSFVISNDLERMQTLLAERLRQLVSKPSAAYTALWTGLDHLGMRVNSSHHTAAPRHRLSKQDLKNLLAQAGSMLIPPMDVAEVRRSFHSTSAIGRTWRRDIGGQRLSTLLGNELLAAIEAKHRSILLVGSPGAGKTCVMLGLQDELEQIAKNRSDLVPLFIQSRDFADLDTAQGREVQGLSAQWVEQVARLAEDAHVVVVIDSLDVLSIARVHSVLSYFLAQIDRLLLVANVTVVTACRDFDRRYDRQIAERTWDKEFKCEPLDWDAKIAPLLIQLGIDASATDVATHELVRNPRELALYVELAQKGGSFNVVTSDALAQRYLDMITQADSALGDAAMHAIEAIAGEMLKLRSLAVPKQRFTASSAIKHALLSQNVLHETHDGQLTFGHQTLLDVLVISGAVRRGVTLNEFIKDLPPVPFVRPTIRSFIARLASGDRREFRKQLRAVLTGDHPFHIRRLVAESLAEQMPLDEDWPLLRDLRMQHREVFQVVYTQASRIEWHYFWFKHLLPILKDARDAEGITTHAYRVSQWKNEDAIGVLAFWADVLAFDWVDKKQLALPMEGALSEFRMDHSALLAPVLLLLLDLPRQEHRSIGRALARCITGGGLGDEVLWRYIVSEVRDEDVPEYRFDKKLHCQPHEFGNSADTFLADRMLQSDVLLDLAVTNIERWSQIRTSRCDGPRLSQWTGFLRATSYANAHDKSDHLPLTGERILLNTMQAAIVNHANNQSDWWGRNRQRLRSSVEGALRYFAILACTSAPTTNLDVIEQMLCNKAFLESDLSYELGTLMQTTFLQLDASAQDAIQAVVLSVYQELANDPKERGWMLHQQAQLIVTIPRHARAPALQAVVNECEKVIWPVVRQPRIGMRGGMINAPFSYQVFLDSSDAAVLQLLAHYNGYNTNSFDNFFTGGERQVGSELRDAASRHPTRFLSLLSTNWGQIGDQFRDDIMDGVATYLGCLHGNLQKNSAWTPVEEAEPVTLALKTLDTLEKHSGHWHHRRSASAAIQGCAHIIEQVQHTERLVVLAIDFSTLEEESSISGDAVNLITRGINMAQGIAAESLMVMAIRLQERGLPWPKSLPTALRLFAKDKNPAVRALLLRRMPHLQTHRPDFGWELFELAIRDRAEGLWNTAESCLHHAYHHRYDIVEPYLNRIYEEGSGKDFETWGRISALVALGKPQMLRPLLEALEALDADAAWQAAASVWSHRRNAQQHQEPCFAGLKAGMNIENKYAIVVAGELQNLLRDTLPLIPIPIELLRSCLDLLKTETDNYRIDISDFHGWLNANSLSDPIFALDATELYLDFSRGKTPHFYDYRNSLTQLLTRLFAQAEEQEQSDGKAMLHRVVVVQDALLALGVIGVNDWLRIAERP